MPEAQETPRYAGFWIRVAAALIDAALILALIMPPLLSIYGMAYFDMQKLIAGTWDILLSWVFPAVAIIGFWIYRSATPGKIMLHLVIVDAATGTKPSALQFIIRYLAYFVSVPPFMLGIIWMAFDKRKQGWHDKLAGTVVIHTRPQG